MKINIFLLLVVSVISTSVLSQVEYYLIEPQKGTIKGQWSNYKSLLGGKKEFVSQYIGNEYSTIFFNGKISKAKVKYIATREGQGREEEGGGYYMYNVHDVVLYNNTELRVSGTPFIAVDSKHKVASYIPFKMKEYSASIEEHKKWFNVYKKVVNNYKEVNLKKFKNKKIEYQYGQGSNDKRWAIVHTNVGVFLLLDKVVLYYDFQDHDQSQILIYGSVIIDSVKYIVMQTNIRGKKRKFVDRVIYNIDQKINIFPFDGKVLGDNIPSQN